MQKKNKKQPPRVFLDSNVVISGLVFPRWPYEIIKYGEAQEIKIVLCSLIIKEVQTRIAVTFPSCLDRFHRFITTSSYEIAAIPSKNKLTRYPNLVRDKKDIPIALSAIKAKVDYLVSNDKDLTVQDQTTKQLREYLQPLQPGTFLKEVMGWTSEELESIRYRTWQDLE
ncbi:MAG: putative toxin-antitoxin system toxin component, PIN family [Nitrospinae bacterium]|nr:putative toxin-antitoxin system toxin component, PIN family [Nitrospinota bacterium]